VGPKVAAAAVLGDRECFEPLSRVRGLVLRKLGRPDEARIALAEYLARAPEASDAALIATLIGDQA